MKAILVVDMPERCADCPLSREGSLWDDPWRCKAITQGKYYRLIEDIHTKPIWCPLRQRPTYRATHQSTWAEGWNACLEQIEGKVEYGK